MVGFLSVLLFIIVVLGICGLIDPQFMTNLFRKSKLMSRKQISIPLIAIVIVGIVLISAVAPNSTKTIHTQEASSNIANSTSAPKVTIKQITETQSIPFTTTNENDNSLDQGQTKVEQNGVDGVETQIYKITYANGIQISKTLMSQSVTTQPVNEVVAIGTYVAPPPVSTPSVAPAPAPSTSSCYPLSDEGTCYEPGEYCRDSDQGTSGVAGDGKSITCEDNDGWRWEPN